MAGRYLLHLWRNSEEFSSTPPANPEPWVYLRVAKLEAALRTREVSSLSTSIEAARDLHERLIAPLLPDLKDMTLLLLCPDGFLWDVPFEVLPVSPSGGTIGGLEYLVLKVPVRYVPSAMASFPRSTQEKAPNRPTRVLVVSGGDEGTLRFSRQEAKAVASLHASAAERDALRSLEDDGVFRGSQTDLLLGQAATPQAVIHKLKSGSHRIVHIASHAVNFEGAPDLSALLLSRGSTGSALTLGEILDLDLASDLVVLSGCFTQKGVLASREGPLALSYAFLLAGARSVVASRFAVDDHATSLLMSAFHLALNKGLPPEAALREAQLSLLKEDRSQHPFFWGAFSVLSQ